MSTAIAPHIPPAAPQTLVRDPALRQAMRAHIQAVIQARVAQDEDRRAEALRDYLAVTQAAADLDAASTLSTMIPPLLPSLYRRWAACSRTASSRRPARSSCACSATERGERRGACPGLCHVSGVGAHGTAHERGSLRPGSRRRGGQEVQEKMADMAAGYIRARVAKLAEKQATKKK
jgi:hypothetical protein